MDMRENKTATRIVSPSGIVPCGVDDFGELVSGRYCLVDKSALIAGVLTCPHKVMLITRPRRFGKTMNQSMLQYFLATPPAGTNTRALFDGLLVSEDAATMAHQGKYPVISLTFKSAKLPTWDRAYSELCRLIHEEIHRHPQALDWQVGEFEQMHGDEWSRLLNRTEATQNDWCHSLELLCKLLALHHNKDNPDQLSWTHPIVLIDEYDAPIHAAYTNSRTDGEDLYTKDSYYGRMVDFIRSLLSNALKGNKYLHKAVLTGIYRVAKEDIFSGLNNLGVYSVLNYRFSSSFGFTENEMEELLTQRGLRGRLDQVRDWYNGYRFGRDTIYNPWSVVSYLANPEEGARLYWVNTSDNAVVHTLLRQADGDMKEELLRLLFGSSKHIVRSILDEAPLRALTGAADELWGLLLASGYATCDKSGYDPVNPTGNIAHLRLPNLEVTSLYKQLVGSWFAQSPRKEQTTGMIKALLDGDGEEFAEQLQEFVHESLSYFDVSQRDPERVYQAFVLGLLVHLEQDYRFRSEREAGKGRADVLLTPKHPNKPGIILEFKRAKSKANQECLQQTAQAALQQIKDKHYAADFADKQCSFVLAVGIAFWHKELATAHERLA